MTSTIERPDALSASTSPARPYGTRGMDILSSAPIAAVVAAAWAAVCGLVGIGLIVLLAWATSGRVEDGVGVPLQAAGVMWLVAHHAGVTTATASVTLLPLALLAIPFTLLHIAGRWAARITSASAVGDVAIIVVAGAAAYAVIAFGVASLAAISGATVSGLPALAGGLALGASGLLSGTLRESGLAQRFRAWLPENARESILVSFAAGATLLACAALVAALSLLLNWSTVVSMGQAMAPGAWEAFSLLVFTLAYLPNLLIWVLAYVAGPGIVVGASASVSAFTVNGTMLPAFPVLGALPSDAPALAPLLLLLPVVAGVVSSIVLRRRRPDNEPVTLADELLTLAAGALMVGAAVAALAALSGGSLGSDRLAIIGPSPVPTGLAVTALVMAGATLWSAIRFLLAAMPLRDEESE